MEHKSGLTFELTGLAGEREKPMKPSNAGKVRVERLVGALALGLTLSFIGCKEVKEVSRNPIGKILDANVVPTAFNQTPKTQVKTERAFIVVLGTPSIPLGVQSYQVILENGQSCLDWDGCQAMPVAMR